MTIGAEDQGPPARHRDVSLDELAQARGVTIVRSVDDMVQEGVFDSDEELDEFLAQVAAQRSDDVA